MPAPIVHVGASVLCMHGGPALPTSPFPRVKVSGMPVVTQLSPYTVTGCALASTSMPSLSGAKSNTGAPAPPAFRAAAAPGPRWPGRPPGRRPGHAAPAASGR